MGRAAAIVISIAVAVVIRVRYRNSAGGQSRERPLSNTFWGIMVFTVFGPRERDSLEKISESGLGALRGLTRLAR